MLLNEIVPVYKRELKAYFQTPATYVALGVFLGFVGLFGFYSALTRYVEMSMSNQGQQGPMNVMEMLVRPMFSFLDFMMMFVAPILTMRLFSEEKRLGSFELLVTCPLRDWSILLGKYLAALTVGWLALILTLAYPAALLMLGGHGILEWPVIGVCFAGSMLVIAAFMALGVFASSVTENQMLSAIVTLIALLSFWILGFLDIFHGKTAFGVPINDILSKIGMMAHLNNFDKGLLSLTDCSYFILFACFFLILTSKILEARRWRV